MKEILEVLSPIIKFIDKKIIIKDNIFTDYYSYGPLYICEPDPLSTLEDKLIFKEVEFNTSSPGERHVTKYYKENDKIIKGIIISMDIIKDETKYFGEDLPDDKSHNLGNNYNIIEESSTTAIEIYLLRNGRIFLNLKIRRSKDLKGQILVNSKDLRSHALILRIY